MQWHLGMTLRGMNVSHTGVVIRGVYYIQVWHPEESITCRCGIQKNLLHAVACRHDTERNGSHTVVVMYHIQMWHPEESITCRCGIQRKSVTYRCDTQRNLSHTGVLLRGICRIQVW